MALASESARLIDTDILVDALRGVADAVNFLTLQHAQSVIQLSVVSAMELIAGCRNAQELTRLQQFLQQATIIPIDTEVSWKAHQLMKEFFLSHGLLIPDALIAATALQHELTLCTRNSRHFQMIPELKLLRPY
ncbi:MAG: type II toxin-antitoxin system VapC family toxin [Fimbriimonadales bacterium]